MIVVWLFLTMPRVCLQFVTVVFPDHIHLLLLRPQSVESDLETANGGTLNTNALKHSLA